MQPIDPDYKALYLEQRHKNQALLLDYNELVKILNTGIEMMEALDEYRKEKVKDKRKLFKVHDIEAIFKRSITTEIERQESLTQKSKAA